MNTQNEQTGAAIAGEQNKLYARLLELCCAKGVAPSRMAMDCGMARSTIARLKTGERKSLTTSNAKKLADYFGVSVDYILGNTDIPNLASGGAAYKGSARVVVTDQENEHLSLWRLLSEKDQMRISSDIVDCIYRRLHELIDYIDFLNFKDQKSPEGRNPDALEAVRQAARDAGMRLDLLEMWLRLPEGRLSNPDVPGVSTTFANEAVEFVELMNAYVKGRHIRYEGVIL